MPGYFDHNATTPLDPRVRDAMLPWLDGGHGNPSSAHRAGRAARAAVEQARAQVASLLGADRVERVVFTASGTEANNAVIAALAAAAGHRGHLVISSFEHPSVHAAARAAAARGMTVTAVPPGPDGTVAAEAVAEALRPDTALVCLMLANNELGTLQPVAEVAALCRSRGIPVASDAVQAAGKVPIRVDELGVDFLIIGGHKFHGPLGAAALWLRSGARFAPLLLGGGQEGGRRASTENVPALVGLGQAAALAEAELPVRAARLSALRDRFEAALADRAEVVLHCQRAPRLPQTSHLAVLGRSGFELMQRLDAQGFAVSIGAACSSGRPMPSPALLAMGMAEDEALASLRVSMGITNTGNEVDELIAAMRALLTASVTAGNTTTA